MVKLSVVMSAYNAQLYIKEAVDSILNQTYTDFEFIIIDDGSTDNTLSILQSYNDSRIKILSIKNIGAAGARNKAISIANGEFIAVMDADDVSLPERFEKQIKFLENNEEYIIVGGNVRYLKDNKLYSTTNYFNSHDDIKMNLLLLPSFANPAVMMRNIGQQYDENFSCEDYRLWTQLIKKGKAHNLSDVVLNYRILENSLSHHKDKEERLYSDANRIIYDYMDSLGLKYEKNKTLRTDKNFLKNEMLFWEETLYKNWNVNLHNKHFFKCLSLYIAEIYYSNHSKFYSPIFILNNCKYIPFGVRLMASFKMGYRITSKILEKVTTFSGR